MAFKSVALLQPQVEVKKDTATINLQYLDGLRGLAALVVMIGHARWLLWEGYSEGYLKHPGDYSFLGKMLVYILAAFKYGHQAVLFFFVLSGFVIHLKYSKSLRKDTGIRFDFGNYLYRRIKRIYPPFLFILLVTFLADSVGMWMGYSIYHNNTPNALLNANITVNHGWINLLGNLFFLQGGKVGIWGTNGPLWSLKFEWWFYMIYPVLFWVNRKSIWMTGVLVVLFFIMALFVPAPGVPGFIRSVLEYLLFWWIGMLLADVYTGRAKLRYDYLSVFTLILPVMIVVGERLKNDLLSDGLWALGYFGLLNLFFYLGQRGVDFKPLSRLKWLGDCSYTLYIIHFPLLVLCNGIILHATGNVMPESMIFVFAGIAGIIGLSWLVHLFIEKPFISRRR